jgi:tRNA A58 N-methylase Trm61
MVSRASVVAKWREPGYHFVGRPWFVHEAILKLEEMIEPGFTVFEWGSGSSTLWFDDIMAASVISVEHDSEWHARTRQELERYDISCVQLLLIFMQPNPSDIYDDNYYSKYILSCPDEHFDLISVDGRNRAHCLSNAIPKLKPGGILVLDNSERKQYQWAIDLLEGWQRWDYVTQGGGYRGWTTTIWVKPNE